MAMAKWNPFADCLIIKDPDAIGFAPYLQKEHAFKTIVTVRHPVAIWSSYKRIGWPGFIADRLRSEAFLKYYDADEHKLLESNKENTPEHILYAISWRLNYRFLHATLSNTPTAKFLTNEQLSLQPDKIRSIANEMQIPWSARCDRWVKRNTTANGRVHPRANQIQDLRRESSKIFASSINAVPESQRNEIQEITWPVAKLFYTQSQFFEYQLNEHQLPTLS